MNYEFKGTKSKWIFNKLFQTIVDTEGYGIAQQNGIKNSRKWAHNALLISKAPEMIEALIKCEKTLREVYECDTTELKELLHSATNI